MGAILGRKSPAKLAARGKRSATAGGRPTVGYDVLGTPCSGTFAVSCNNFSISLQALVLTLFSYPELYEVADNNPYGLKVFAFLRLCRLNFRHEHIFDSAAAPRQQLPYIVDDEHTVGDSDAIISYVKSRYDVAMDEGLTAHQLDLNLLLRRLLDDLYWVMSYSRWKDPRFWPIFRQALLDRHPSLSAESLEGARHYNFERYRYQGIGRYEPEEAYGRGIADIEVLAKRVPDAGFAFGPKPTSCDAAIYGFTANIYFYAIETPLRRELMAHSNLVRHCLAVHSLLDPPGGLV
jgi:glutathione S-transferase